MKKKRPLQVSFYDRGRGWLLLRLSLPEKTIHIDISAVFDPFPEIFRWIEDICVNDLPSQVEVSHQGIGLVNMVASTLKKDAKDSILLEIYNSDTNQMLAKSELSKYDFITTFLNRYDSFVNRIKDKRWCGYNLDEFPCDELREAVCDIRDKR